MARFSDLSNEVIVMISQCIRPSDLDSFLLTSKHIKEVNEVYIAAHLMLRKLYKRVVSGTRATGIEKFGSLAILLKKVLIVPRAASYVEEFDIRGWYMGWQNDSHLEDPRNTDMLSEKNRKIFDQATTESKYVPTGDVDEWMEGYEDGLEDQILGLLLTLLPNLSVLHIGHVSDWSNLLTTTVGHISQDPKPKALTMLTRVTLSGSESQAPLHVVKAFAVMPSMRQIRAENVGITHDDQYASPKNSRVTDLCLNKCLVPPEYLYDFISSFEALITFEYTEGTRFHDDAVPGSNGFWIRSSLQHQAKQSLKKLTMRSPHRKLFTLMGSLRLFAVLEELDVDLGALIASNSPGSGVLTQVLPASITKVTLRHPSTGSAMVEGYPIRILHDVLKQRKRALPRLQALNFRPNQNSKIVKFKLRDVAECEAAGITLSVD